MSDRSRQLTRTLLGYSVLAVGLYLTYLTGSDDYTLSIYAFAFLVVAIYIAFEKMNELIELVEATGELKHAALNDDDADDSGDDR